jgi:hypothetical protein
MDADEASVLVNKQTPVDPTSNLVRRSPLFSPHSRFFSTPLTLTIRISLAKVNPLNMPDSAYRNELTKHKGTGEAYVDQVRLTLITPYHSHHTSSGDVNFQRA